MTTSSPTAFELAVARTRAGADPGHEAERLLDQMTPEEKLWLLDGDEEFWTGIAKMSSGYNTEPIVMGAVARLGVPGFRFSDGPRGVVMGQSTAFPVSMARGATWDVELEERVGVAIGREMRAQGGNLFAGVCINLPRHPAWGRAQETYGEDPVVLGAFGAALTRGVQRNGMAMAKHYALNSMENARFRVDVTASPAALHEVYLAHFRRVVEEGVDGIMSSYNSVNGEWAGQNEELLEGVLRRRWGFEGITMTDFVSGFRDPVLSLQAGLDVEAPSRQQRAQALPSALERGEASWADVNRAGVRILRTQLRHYASDREEEPSPDVVLCADHLRLAREVATRAITLLKNDQGILPLDASNIRSIAVIGRLADTANTGDRGSSHVRSPNVVTALQGIREAFPAAEIIHVPEDDPQAAARAAARADVALVVAGYTAADEGEYVGGGSMSDPGILALFPPLPDHGDIAALMAEAGGAGAMGGAEGGDRASLRLRAVDEDIIRAAAAANPRTIVSIVTAGAVIMESWRPDVPAILVSWYGGAEGGHALADVLTGKADASGRLPYSIPLTEEHLPYFDRDASAITYDRWFGQRLLDRDGNPAAYPLGYGLSYTSMEIIGVAGVEIDGEHVNARVRVVNRGDRDGHHVVQLYGVTDADDFPRRVLLGFAPLQVEAGGAVDIDVTGSLRPLQRWTGDGFEWASTAVTIEAAAYSGDPDAATAQVQLAGASGKQR